MICKICNNENRCPYFICYRCINTSPNLIFPLKIKLIQEISITKKLSEQVNTILEGSLKYRKNNSDSNTISNDDRNIIKILGYQLKKVQLFKELRRNNKIKQNIQVMEERLENKRKELSKLESLLLLHKTTFDTKQPKLGSNSFDITSLIEWEMKVKEINSFLKIQQINKMNQLNRWFGIDSNMKKDNFKLFYQPIVTIQTLKDNSNNINNDNENCLISNNLKFCLKYLRLISQIFYIHIPYSEGLKENFIINLEYDMSLLIYYCYIICQRLKLFPKSKKGYTIYTNVRLLLKDYTINEILYNISRCGTLYEKNVNVSFKIEGKNYENNDEYSQMEWTLPMIHQYIEELCNDNSDISSKDTVILPQIKQKKRYASYLHHNEINNNNNNNTMLLKRIIDSNNKNNINTNESFQMNKTSLLQRNGKYIPVDMKSSPSTVKITTTTKIKTKTKPKTDTNGKEETTTTDRWFVVG